MSDSVTPTEPEVTTPDSVAAKAEPEDSEGGDRRPSGEHGFWGLVAKLTALLVLISTAVGLAVTLWPDPTPPPPKQDAELTGRVTPGLTFREYLALVGQDPGGLSDDVLRRRGALLRFTVVATGYKSDQLTLRWRVLKGRVHPTLVKSDHIAIMPGADEDTVIPDPAFAPFPETGRRFTLEADLIAPDDVTIAHDEEPFRRQ
jgi:hypothetical protein